LIDSLMFFLHVAWLSWPCVLCVLLLRVRQYEWPSLYYTTPYFHDSMILITMAWAKLPIFFLHVTKKNTLPILICFVK
jgi:hypothetical protein